VTTLRGHSSWLISVAFSPNGKLLLSASQDKTAKLWEAPEDRHPLTLRGHRDWILAVAFSSDSQRIITASEDKTARLWNATTGKQLLTLEVPGDDFLSAAFSPDGRLLGITSADHLVRIWDVVANRLLWVSPGAPIGFMRDVAFSPDGGKIAAVADDANVYVWDVSTGTLSNTFEDTLMASFGLAFTRDGKHLMVGGASSEIFVLNLSAGTLEQTFGRERNVVASLKLSPRGDMVASRYRNPADTAKPAPIIVWDIASGKAKFKLEIPNTHFGAVSWNESGMFVTSWSDGGLHVWTVPRLSNGGKPR